ncbi:MAG: hypothetical protein LBG80_19305 [Bacteroidales bacterium]|jgi:hypothetical protein|nr:hypothetical protein [Bacteroidales bacterium]
MKRNGLLDVIFCIVLVFGMILLGCDLGDNGNDNGNTTLVKLNIIDATNLFIAPSSSSAFSARATGASSSNKLFKITEDGYVQEVTSTYEDEDGNVVSSTETLTPTAIYNIDDNYIIVVFSSDGFLVRKNDGTVFSLKNVGLPDSGGTQQNNYHNASVIQKDSSGNIYYATGTHTPIVKIDISNPNNLTKTDIVQPLSTDQISAYDIDLNGNIVYSYYSTGGIVERIKKANGGLINLPHEMAWWIGLDGKIKYYTHGQKIITYTIEPPSYTETVDEQTVDIGPVSLFQGPSTDYIKISNRILVIALNNYSWFIELENPSNAPRNINIAEIDNIRYVANSENYYYLSGNNASNQPVLLRINPQTDQVTTLLSPNKYDIYSMTVDNNDKVTFNALRMSDGVKVFGEVSLPNGETILDETLNVQVVSLERVN